MTKTELAPARSLLGYALTVAAAILWLPAYSQTTIIKTDATASQALAALLNAYYTAHPEYAGGAHLFLRLNSDLDLGLTNVGWDLAPVENIAHSADPLLVITTAKPGDYNQDGTVDAADYVMWRKTGVNGSQGYETWRANFGASSVGGSSTATNAAVPEPAASLLLILATAGLYLLRR